MDKYRKGIRSIVVNGYMEGNNQELEKREIQKDERLVLFKGDQKEKKR